jgi:hypothetical protein
MYNDNTIYNNKHDDDFVAVFYPSLPCSDVNLSEKESSITEIEST